MAVNLHSELGRKALKGGGGCGTRRSVLAHVGRLAKQEAVIEWSGGTECGCIAVKYY
jgi:hypothetical protein